MPNFALLFIIPFCTGIFCILIFLSYRTIHQWPSTTNVTLTTGESSGTAAPSWVLHPTLPRDLTNSSLSGWTSTPPGAHSVHTPDLLPGTGEPLTRHIPPQLPHFHFYIYLGLFVGFVIVAMVRASLFSVMAVRASHRFHTRMFRALMKTPLSFFEKFATGKEHDQ